MKLLVNIITTFRFVYTLFLPLLRTKISSIAFILNVIFVFLTDSIDGTLARKFKVQTIYGSSMDAIADKTLSIVLMILLLEKIKLISLVIIGEILIAIINSYALLKGKKTKSSKIGKLKMWFLGITIVLGFMYYFEIIPFLLLIIALILTTIIQIITIIDYIISLKNQKPTTNQFRPKEKYRLKEILFSTEYYLKQYKI